MMIIVVVVVQEVRHLRLPTLLRLALAAPGMVLLGFPVPTIHVRQESQRQELKGMSGL